jgi:SOS response regulatory protein OraA/RecX
MAGSIVVQNIRKKGRVAVLVIADSTKADSGDVILGKGDSNSPEVVIDSRILIKYGIRRDTVIELSQLKEIIFESDLLRAKDYVIYLLSRSGYSVGLLKNKLSEKEYSPKVTAAVIAEFQRLGLLDDRRYAKNAVEAIMRRKPAGRNYLLAYLQSRHISRNLASEVVEEIIGGLDETELAMRLIRKRWSYLAKFELETARTKAYNYLSRRSIGYRAAKLAFEKILKEEHSH